MCCVLLTECEALGGRCCVTKKGRMPRLAGACAKQSAGTRLFWGATRLVRAALLLLCSTGCAILNSVFLEAGYTADAFRSLASLFAVTARVNEDVGPGGGVFGGKGMQWGENV